MTPEEAELWYSTGYDGYKHEYTPSYRPSSSSTTDGYGTILCLLWFLLCIALLTLVCQEVDPATPVEANTPVELLEVEHQRVIDSIELEHTIALKELELKQLK